MAWNEPGGNKKDPWGGNRGNNGDGPPELDEIFKNLQKKLSGLFGGNGGSGGGSGASPGAASGIVIAIIIAVILVIYVVRGAGIVNEQERAVVLRLGKYKETREPGFRWNPPLIDQVYPVNVTKVQEYPLSQQMLSKDLNIVDIDISVQFVINDARNFVLNVRAPIESLHQAANSALRHVAGSTMMHGVLTEAREQVAEEIKTRLQSYLDNYQTGIFIETVNVEESKPPREVQDAFDDVIEAREDEERYKNEAQTYSNGIIPEARGNAQRMVEEANAYKERVIAQSEGETKRFEYLLEIYQQSPEVTRERLYLDTMQEVMGSSSKVLLDVEGGNNMLYLPMDKLMGTQSTSAPQSPARMSSGEVRTLSDQVMQNLIDRGYVPTVSRRSSSARGGK